MRWRWLIAVLGLVPFLGCVTPTPHPRDTLFQNPVRPGQPVFFVDYAGFESSEAGNSRLEIYYQVYNLGLQFHKDSGEFEADYNFTAVVTDDAGNRVKVFEQNRKLRVPTEDETKSHFDYRSSQFNLDAPPGEYTLDCTLKDMASQATRQQTIKANLRKFSQRSPVLSDIQFALAAQEKTDEKSVFVKDNLSVIPSVSRLYGGEDSARLLYYVEAYLGSDLPGPLYLETIIRSDTKGMLYRDTLYISLTSPTVRQMKNIGVEEFPPGDYSLEIYLRGRRAHLYDQRTGEFTIQWSQERMLKYDFSTAIRQLELIATSAEIGKMKNLKTIEERVAAFNAFWDARNTTAGIGVNEVKREFYRRVTYANRQFRHLRLDGWRTDRGRIYIKYGEPDQIDDFPMSANALPYQVWHYYRQGSYLRFKFVDENEDGDYRLQYPYDGANQRPDF